MAAPRVAEGERQVQLPLLPSLWGHPAGTGASPADRAFLNQGIATFLAGQRVARGPPPKPLRDNSRI